MKAFLTYVWIQFKIDLRNRGTLLTYYFTPLVFFLVMGAVFSSITPQMKATLAASMTIFAATMGAVMGVPVPIVRMRESGTVRAFKVSGIPGGATLAVSAVSAFVHLFLVSLIIYLIAPAAFHADLPKAPALYFAVLAVFLASSIGIGILIGVWARGQSFATMLSMVVFLPSLLLSGIMFPASLLPQALAWAGRIFPATYALQAFYGLAYGLETDLNPALSLLVVAGIGLVMYGLAGWRFGRVSRSEEA